MINTRGAVTRVFLIAVLVAGTGIGTAKAQWEPYPNKNMPRTPDGKVDLNAPTRKTAAGKPDFSGFWMPAESVKNLIRLDADLKPGEVPLTPWGQQVYQQRIDTNGKDHPGRQCLPSGIPEKNHIPDGLKGGPPPELLIFLYEPRTIYRQVFMDGRPLQKNPQPT